jgi:hypothetical protein
MTHYVNHTAPSALLRAHGFDVSGADSLKKAFWAPRFAFTIEPAVLAQLVALVFPWLAAFRQKVRIAACSVLYAKLALTRSCGDPLTAPWPLWCRVAQVADMPHEERRKRPSLGNVLQALEHFAQVSLGRRPDPSCWICA